ncbi:MAG: hypothetical protein KDA22_06850, partial [Phycisphaerales bacterium]|nr:hypothetical protein [Phycisphaerales bacterium]
SARTPARTASIRSDLRLRIAHPTANAVHIALDGQAAVGVQAVLEGSQAGAVPNLDATATERRWWFVNGRPVEPEAGSVIRLAPGRWEIRCADAAGRHDAVAVVVSDAGP